MRTTDHARRIVRRAQALLGALAVVIAVPVGVAAAQPQPGPREGVVTVAAEPLEPGPAPEVAVADATVSTSARWSTPDGAVHTGTPWAKAGLAPGAVRATEVDAAGQAVAPGSHVIEPLNGLLAGVVTLLTCWALLAVAVATGRARLAARDARRWAADWARIEPTWSGRG